VSLKPLSRKAWTLEDVLLYDCWEQCRGTVYAGVAAPRLAPSWPANPLPRRIGALRVSHPEHAGAEARILDWAEGEEQLRRVAAGAECEAIVAGRRLTRALIGEALTGAELLRMAAGARNVRPVILCLRPDSALLEVCEERGIIVWQPAWVRKSILDDEFDEGGLRSHPSGDEAGRRQVRFMEMLVEHRTLEEQRLDIMAMLGSLACRLEQALGVGGEKQAEPQPAVRAEGAGNAGACGGHARGNAVAGPLDRWTKAPQRTAEDFYLLEFWKKAGGVIYGDVALPVGGPQRKWRQSADGGRVGAVRVVPPEGSAQGAAVVSHGQCLPGELQAVLSGRTAWVIRAGMALTRELIGEVVAGSDLLRRAFAPARVTPVIFCDDGDPLLEMVCRRLRIEVRQA
jgi:hypothetical protein